jgi:serine/threonine protein kinase
MARPRSTPSIGGIWADRYELQRLLGQGSRKQVYLAYDKRLDRDVALSLIETEGLDSASRERVRREAHACTVPIRPVQSVGISAELR